MWYQGAKLQENSKKLKPHSIHPKIRIFVPINILAMQTKLTLKLSREVIDNAKQYAADKKLSLSRIIENYLIVLTAAKENTNFEISPFIKSLSSGIKIPTDYNYRKDRAYDLSQKHK